MEMNRWEIFELGNYSSKDPQSTEQYCSIKNQQSKLTFQKVAF